MTMLISQAGATRVLAPHVAGADLAGRSPAMRALFSAIDQLSPCFRTVLVTGETGTGKELVARALHAGSPRHRHPLVTINCSTSVAHLFEQDPYGSLAGPGTVFLDEVEDLPPDSQAALLERLDNGDRSGEVRPVAARAVHVIAATNHDLLADVSAGRFLADLYYRLTALHMHVPPLRARGDDVVLLARVFTVECAGLMGRPAPSLTVAAEERLLTHHWPGNVRELRNAITRACLLGGGMRIDAEDLDLTTAPSRPQPDRPARPPSDADLRQAMIANGGNKSHAAARLGISRRALYRHLERLERRARDARDVSG